ALLQAHGACSTDQPNRRDLMDIHARIAACLHIATAVLFLFVLLALGAVIGAFGALGASVGIDSRIAEWVGGLGVTFLGLMALLPLAAGTSQRAALRPSPLVGS